MSKVFSPEIGPWPLDFGGDDWAQEAKQTLEHANQLKQSQYQTWTTQSTNWITPPSAYLFVPAPQLAAPPLPPEPPKPAPVVELALERKFSL